MKAGKNSHKKKTYHEAGHFKPAARLIWIGAFLIFAMLLFFPVLLHHSHTDIPGATAPVRVLNTASVSVEGEGVKECRLPLRLSGLAPRTKVTAVFKIHNADPSACIQVRSAFSPLQVKINGRLRYSFGEQADRPRYMADPGTIIHMVPVQETGTATITLSYQSPVSRNSMTVGPVYLSTPYGLLQYDRNLMGKSLILSLLIAAGGTVLVLIGGLVTPLERKGLILVWVGLFSFVSGIWGMTNCDLTLFFVHSSSLLYLLSYLSFFLLLLPLDLFLENYLGFHYQKYRIALRTVFMAAILISVILQFTGILMFPVSVRFFQIFLPAYLAMMTARTFWEAIRHKKKNARFLAFPMCILFVFTILELFSYRKSTFYSDSGYYITGAAIFCVFMCIAGALEIRRAVRIHRREEEQEYELNLLNIELAEQRKYQQTLVEHENQIRRQRHDYRHHLTVLLEYNRQDRHADTEKYLTDLLGEVSVPKQKKYCENLAINAVLSYYAQRIAKQDVPPDIRVILPDTLSASLEKELCVVFGNLLENACESLQRIPDMEADGKSFVSLSTTLHMGNLIIHMENSVRGTTRKWGDFFVSNKTGEVGIGLSSIASVAEKEGGSASFRRDGDVFYSDVYLFLEQGSEGSAI